MKLAADCYECLQRLIHQASKLATNDPSLQEIAIREAINILDRKFSYSQLSIVIATEIHRIIREITHNPDPYKVVKEKEMALARELLSSQLLQVKRDNLRQDEFQYYLKLAAAANALDFFTEPELAAQELGKPVSFVIDHSQLFATQLKNARKVLYLADNAGEIYFDLPLVKWIRQFAEVAYAVKPSPVQDDLTLADVEKAGLEKELGKVITTGVASPGIILSLASAQFKQEFGSADLIFAKGMGYYEALSELPRQGKFFYCLKVKCQPVAASLGVPINSYVAMLQ